MTIKNNRNELLMILKMKLYKMDGLRKLRTPAIRTLNLSITTILAITDYYEVFFLVCLCLNT